MRTDFGAQHVEQQGIELRHSLAPRRGVEGRFRRRWSLVRDRNRSPRTAHELAWAQRHFVDPGFFARRQMVGDVLDRNDVDWRTPLT
ncbi:MAG: hypothetical protein ACREES_10420, partial [Stellaceae bacterium]